MEIISNYNFSTLDGTNNVTHNFWNYNIKSIQNYFELF